MLACAASRLLADGWLSPRAWTPVPGAVRRGRQAPQRLPRAGRKDLPPSPTPFPPWPCLSPRTKKNWHALAALATSTAGWRRSSQPAGRPGEDTHAHDMVGTVPYAWTRCAAGRPLSPGALSRPPWTGPWGKCVSFWMRWRARPLNPILPQLLDRILVVAHHLVQGSLPYAPRAAGDEKRLHRRV